ncbi:uncharacterized protein LOC141914491 [Tubulanus polymorphus]|uniref:uncharacterized protein LOC141914491 n=1 Tax=Tubulanus polymorphus TaxID=672921 RepID=UPI003DA63942
MKTCLFLIICTVLLLLGDLYIIETSGTKTNEITIHLKPVPDDKPDIKTEGEEIDYTCKTLVGNPTVIFQQKRQGSEQWEPIPGDQRSIIEKVKHVKSVKLVFKADFKLHNGTIFRCLIVKENQTFSKPRHFDIIVVHRTGLNLIPATVESTSRVPLVTTENVGSKNKTDQIQWTTPDWTTTIVYITSGAICFLLIIVIIAIAIIIIICRRRRLFGEGRVDTTPPQQQVEMVYDVYEELYDDLESDTDTSLKEDKNPYENVESGKGKDTSPYIDMEAGKAKDTSPYIDMDAEKANDTSPYIKMESGKGKDTTPYMNMGAEKDKDTIPYINTGDGKDKDTTPYKDMEAEKGKDASPYMDMEAEKGKDTTPYMDMEADGDRSMHESRSFGDVSSADGGYQ